MDAKNSFYESCVGLYPGMLFRVIRAERCDVSATLKDKYRLASDKMRKEGCSDDEMRVRKMFYTPLYADEENISSRIK